MSDTNADNFVVGIRKLYPFGFLLALIALILMFLVEDLFYTVVLSVLACAGLIAASLWIRLRLEKSNPKLAKIFEYIIVAIILVSIVLAVVLIF